MNRVFRMTVVSVAAGSMASVAAASGGESTFAASALLDQTAFVGALVQPATQADDPVSDGADESAIEAALEASRTPLFGAADTWRFTIQGAFAGDVKGDDNYLGLAGVGASYFLVDNLSINFELNGMYVDQGGQDDSAIGLNFNLLFRWHFLARENWSLYIDGGAGMLYTSSDVPDNGSGFNFTPQAGLGASFALDRGARLLLGARWHHISNANTYTENPGRDSIEGYVGLSFPM